MPGNKRMRAGVLSVSLLVASAGGLVLHQTSQPQKSVSCKATLQIRVIDGREVVVQDRDPDGTDCDLDQTMRGAATLGIDCKIRSSKGKVLATERSSREDGTCGLDSPAE